MGEHADSMDEILMMGDMAEYDATFGAATITGTRMKPLVATGMALVLGRSMAVKGDEMSVTIEGVSYISGSFTVAGTGTLKILKLNRNQTAKTKLLGRKILLKGTKFDAIFEVQSPATDGNPLGPMPDPTASYMGEGKFKAFNKTIKDRS